ncbi:MAG: 1-deoxy-D-xylulose-5-phosphate synthase [Anaerovoracaceae bacterium]
MKSKPLEEYNFPADLKTMSVPEMELLAVQIRDFLIEHVSRNGGHLSSNLGVVELSIALHRVFNPPHDRIVWDVGHQSYVHKILTGRADRFDTLRRFDGLRGFPSREESPCDAFDTGHASTSISIIAGMAAARELKGENYETVAVIGDGSLTGGPAYEGLNNLGTLHAKSIIIINDNGMSIRRNTGAMSTHLSKLRVSSGYYRLKRELGGAVQRIPRVGEHLYHGLGKMRDMVKYVMVDGVLFEELGFTYLGPIDGHNLTELMQNLRLAKKADNSVVLHVVTRKGRGYRNAEKHPGHFHGTGPFDPETGRPRRTHLQPCYSQIFGHHLTELARQDERITAITAAMTDGTGLNEFERAFPHRLYDVGIAEGHAATFAGGLAVSGMRPVVAVYSSFLQRAYDQILEDVCLQNLPVVFAIDRAGIVGADGPTHHGVFDLSFLTQMPNMTVMAPCDGRELEAMMDYALQLDGPSAIRYPRGESHALSHALTPLTDGAQVLQAGRDVEIWAIGAMVRTAVEAASLLRGSGIEAGVVNARFAKPVDRAGLIGSARRTKLIVTLEDNVLNGGFGDNAAREIDFSNDLAEVIRLGWPDVFLPQGSCEEIRRHYGLTAPQIAERIRDEFETQA